MFTKWTILERLVTNLSKVITIDLSIWSTETKYIKLNTETQYIFCCANENLTTFLYTLTGGTRKQKEKKKVLCIQKSNVIKNKGGV